MNVDFNWDVNGMIDQIAGYLGVSADTIMQFVPQYAEKYSTLYFCNALIAAFTAVLGIILVISSFIVYKKVWKPKYEPTSTGRSFPYNALDGTWKTHWYISEIYIIAAACLGIILIMMGLIGMVVEFKSAYIWSQYPEITALQDIINRIGRMAK